MGTQHGKNIVIVAALVAAGFFLAYLRFRPYLGTEGTYTDGEAVYEDATGEAIRFAVWDQPTPLSADVNTEARETRPAISPDGLYMVFSVGEVGFNTDLWLADMVQGQPVNARPLGRINTAADETAPSFSHDGLYFASNRGNSEGGLDIYRADYRNGIFGIARNLGTGVNTEADETDPAPVPGTLSLAFASNRTERGDFDLFFGEPNLFTDPQAANGEEPLAYNVEALDGLNSLFEEREPAFASDGLTMVYATDRHETVGGFDLYRTVIDQGAWAPPQPVSGINTENDERGAYATPDGFTLFFTVFGPEGNGDLFYARSRELFRLPGKPIGWLDLSILAGLFLLALLAFLAKRWVSLDIVYKCVIISLLVHLLMIWWFRDVVPEGSVTDLPEKDSAYKVRIAVDPTRSLADARERGGQVEVTRQTAAAAQALQKSESVLTENNPTSAPEVAMDRSDAPQGESPDRSEQTPERSQQVAQAEVQTQQPEVQYEKQAGSAPAMAVNSQQMPDHQPQSEAGEVSRADSAEAAVAQAQPTARSQQVAQRQMDASPQSSEVASQVQPETATPTGSAVAVSQPTENFAKLQGSAKALAMNNAPAAQSKSHSSEVANPDRKQTAQNQPSQVQPTAQAETWTASGLALAVKNVKRNENANKRIVPTETQDTEVEMTDAVAMDPSFAEGRDAPAPSMSMPDATPSESRDPNAIAAGQPTRAETAETQELSEMMGQASGSDSQALALAPSQMPSRAPQRTTSQVAPLQRHNTTTSAVAVAQPTTEFTPVSQPVGEQGDVTELAPLAMGSPTRPTTAVNGTPTKREFKPTPKSGGGTASPDAGPAVALNKPAGDGSASPAPTERATTEWTPSGSSSSVPEVAVRAPESGGGSSPTPTESQPSGDGDFGKFSPTSMGERTVSAAPGHGPTRKSFGTLEEGPALRPAHTPIAAAEPQEPAEYQDPIVSGPEPSQWEHTPYKTRFGAEKSVAIEEHGGSEETERAVERGLAYLASKQQDQGHWGTHHYYHGKYGYTAIGKTGLAMLAFMGAGHTHKSDSQYSDTVQGAIDFLLSVQDEATGHFSYTASYSHGIATYALAECYALTQDPKLRRPLQRAVKHILSQQNQTRDRRLFGGWGYYYSDERTYDQWPRASITAWQVMALESARLGGIEIADEVFANAKIFLLNSQDETRGFFRYSHDPERLRSNYPTLPGSTPASLFALSILGEDPTGDRYSGSREFILRRAPREYRYTSGDDFVYRAAGNIYFWYYGTLAMFRTGGQSWDLWNERIKGTLLPGQQPDGSWMPISLYADYAGDSEEDRTYTTAMCVLCLEVYYRYFTPLLKVK